MPKLRNILVRELRDECEAFINHFDSFAEDPDTPCGPECPELKALWRVVRKAVKHGTPKRP